MMNLSNKVKELKRHKKYKKRKKFLSVVWSLVLVLVVLLMSPLYTGGGKVNLKNTDNQSVVSGAEVYKISSKLNPQTGFMVSEFFVGDKKDVDSVSADAALSNIKYDYRSVVQHGGANGISKMIKVNDHYFVIETKGLKPKFNVLRYDIAPELINSKIDTEGFQKDSWLKFYTKESDVEKDASLQASNLRTYSKHYTNFILKSYYKVKTQKLKQVQSLEDTIAHNEKVLDKLRKEKALASQTQREEIDDQISNMKDDINTDKQNIRQIKKEISQLNGNIDAVKRGFKN